MQYWYENQLKQKAATFLEQYHPTGSIPIPIETIVEILLKIEIVPIPFLRSKYKMDGCISMDLQTITVDQDLIDTYVNRYRFTLAHEVGHWELHANIIRSRNINCIEEWRTGIVTISEKDYSGLEWQANCFAGHLLVPSPSLKVEFARLCTNRIDLEIQDVENMLAQIFEVSSEVIKRRLIKEGLFSLPMLSIV